MVYSHRYVVISFIFWTMVHSAYPVEITENIGTLRDHVELDELVATADRVQRDALTVAANVTVITAKDIARMNAQSLPEILKFSSGIEVADRFGNGRKSTVDIRGFGETAASNTLVLVDGRRINGADLSGIDWTTIPLDRIARIEIVRGGNGVIYGDNATGGTINIITKEGYENNRIFLEFDGGEYETYNPSIDLSGSLIDGSLTYSFNGGYRDSNGFRDNGFFRNKTAAMGLNYHNESGLTIEISGGVKDDRYGLPGSISEAENRRSTTDPDNFAETAESYLRLVPRYQLNAIGEVNVAVDYRVQEQFSLFVDPSSVIESVTDITEIGISPQFRNKFHTAGVAGRLTVGFDFFQSDIDSELVFDGSLTASEGRRTSNAAYIHEVIAVLENTLFVDLGYRHDRVNHDFEAARDTTRNVDAAKFGLTWNYLSNNKIFLAYDRSFRTQLLDELGGSFFNEPLKPQISEQLQLGLEHLLGFGLRSKVTVFEIKTDNEILFDPNFVDPNAPLPFPGQNVNYEETRRRGIELELNLKINDRMETFVNYTHIDPELTAGDYQGNSIPGVAKNSGSFGLYVTPFEKLTVSARARWVDDRIILGDWENTVDWDDDFFVTDVKISYALGDFVLYGGVNNLLDEEYSEIGGFNSAAGVEIFPSPDRNFVFGVRYSRSF